MRICLIAREYPPDTGWGGIGTYTYQIAHGLKEIGHDVEVASLTAEQVTEAQETEKIQETATSGQTAARRRACQEPKVYSREEEGILVHRATWPSPLPLGNMLPVTIPNTFYVLRTILGLWQAFEKAHALKPFDVAEVPEHLAGPLLPTMCKALPVVVKLHTPHSKFTQNEFHNFTLSFDNQIVNMLERLAMLSSPVICSPSEDLATYVAQDTGIPAESIHIIRNPVNSAQFTPAGERVFAEDGRLRIMFAGRLEERKGIIYLIQAVPSVVKEFPQAKFVVIGKDTDTAPGGGSMLASLKQFLVANNCQDNVQFISQVQLSQMPSYYRSADICVIPSLYDNAPYTCIEALASGKPVVVTTAGGTQEYVLPGRTGLVVEPRHPEAIASAILELLREPIKRQRFGQTARDYVLEKLDRKQVAKAMLPLYEEAVRRFNADQEASLYLKPAKQMIPDALELARAYERMTYDALYRQSYGFRLNHWRRLAFTRPRLFAATAFLKAASAVVRVGAGKDPDQVAFIRNLRQEIAAKRS